jgi:integrase
MARIRKHRAKWQVLFREPATKKERSAGVFTRRSDAEKVKREIEYRIATRTWTDPASGEITLHDWSHRWMQTKAGLKRKTLDGYAGLLTTWILPAFGSFPLNQIDPAGVDGWVAGMKVAGLSPVRIRQAHQVLSSMLKAAVRERRITNNPAQGATLPRVRRTERVFLTPVQVAELAAAIAEPFSAWVYTMAYTGLRWGEAAGLRRDRVDLLHGEIIVDVALTEVRGNLEFETPKSEDSRRSVFIPAAIGDILDCHLAQYVGPAPDSLVFSSPGRSIPSPTPQHESGTPLRNSNFNRRVWRPAVRAAGLPDRLRIHDLRHTAAAIMISEGAPLEVVKAQLGHSSISVTSDFYGHLYRETRRRYVSDLDRVFAAAADQMQTTAGGAVVGLER